MIFICIGLALVIYLWYKWSEHQQHPSVDNCPRTPKKQKKKLVCPGAPLSKHRRSTSARRPGSSARRLL